MRHTATLLFAGFFFCLLPNLSAQNFRIQIAAYAQAMPDTFFREKGVTNVIASRDQMGMFRYFAGSCKTRDEAEGVQKEMIARGFAYASVVDLEEQRALSDLHCAYDRPGQGTKQEGNIYFDFGSQALSPEAKTELDAVCQKMKEDPSLKLNLLGYTDAVGSSKANIELATDRARTARDYLINKGIRADRMFIKVFGEAAPAAANSEEDNDGKKGDDLPENRKWNRRVVLMLIDESGEVKVPGAVTGGK